MSRLNDFIVNITLDTLPETRLSFGNILLLETDVDHEYKTYKNITAVLEDFANTTDTYKLAEFMFAQKPAPTQIAIAGIETIVPAEATSKLSELISKSWASVVSTNNANAFITAISAWADLNDKFYAVTTQDLTLFDTIMGDNTLMQYHDDEGQFLAEALLVYIVVRPIGSCTAKFKRLEKVTEAVITDTQLESLHEKNGGTYIKDMGVIQTTNSTAQSGEYFDVILGKYWIKLEMERELRTLALRVDKIPYSNAGIAMLVSLAEKVLKQAAENGIILLDDSGNALYTVNSKKREAVDRADRTARTYNSISWTADLAGAIEGGTISGTLSV